MVVEYKIGRTIVCYRKSVFKKGQLCLFPRNQHQKVSQFTEFAEFAGLLTIGQCQGNLYSAAETDLNGKSCNGLPRTYII